MDRKLEEYLAYLGSVRGLSARTLSSYREDLDRFESFMSARLDPARGIGPAREGSVPGAPSALDSAEARDVRSFAAALVSEGKAGSSVNRALSAVRGFYRYRVRFGGLASDPSRDVEGLPSRRPLPRFLFEDEAASFVSLPKGDDFGASRDAAMLEFLYSTGCRVGEAAGLTLDRLDLGGGSAKVLGKGSKERVVFLTQTARAALAAYLPHRAERVRRLPAQAVGKEHLFVNARGGRLTERGIEWIVEGYAERSRFPRKVTPHAFRHSFATHMVGRGADIRVVQELLGHASVSTTQVYAHVDMERLRKVYEQAHPHGASAVRSHGASAVRSHGGNAMGPRGGNAAASAGTAAGAEAEGE
jgi:integrase/recombinase XerC